MSNSLVEKHISQAINVAADNRTLSDKVVSWFSPSAGLKRMQARSFMALAGGYNGGSRARASLKGWRPGTGDADSEINPDRQTLVDNSRDLVRNNPLASGQLNTKSTYIVGGGLRLQCRIDRDAIGLSDDAADDWEAKTEREFRMWASSKDCDAERSNNFYGLTELAFRSSDEAGDVFALLPYIKRKTSLYQTSIQLIEGDRVCNKDNAADTDKLSGGIAKDNHGAPQTYHILKGHPGNRFTKSSEWLQIPAYGSKSGRRNVIHLFRKKRPGQSRGVPELAPVIELIKQLGTYTDTEVSAAVLSAYYAVFIKSEGGGDGATGVAAIGSESSGTSAGDANDFEFKAGEAVMLELAADEEIQTAAPGRPNVAFDPFVLAIFRQIGMALELPYELLIKHFSSSYSASQAAMLDAWKTFKARRSWLADNFCRPIYEEWMIEAVSLGRIHAPGFLTDPAIRAAYLGSEWIGPARGMIKEKEELQAAKLAVELGVKDFEEITAELAGGDFGMKIKRLKKQETLRIEAGLPATNGVKPMEQQNAG